MATDTDAVLAMFAEVESPSVHGPQKRSNWVIGTAIHGWLARRSNEAARRGARESINSLVRRGVALLAALERLREICDEGGAYPAGEVSSLMASLGVRKIEFEEVGS